MTAPTITYGQGYLSDCNETSSWSGPNNSADPLTNPSITLMAGDYLRLAGTPDSVADEYVYWLDASPNFSTSIYTKYVARWRTSHSGNGLGARIDLIWAGGGQQSIVGPTPEFSTAWTVSTGTLTAGKTITDITISANDYPDSIAAGANFWVDYDFILLYTDTFTFPHVHELELLMENRYVDLQPPLKGGEVTQFLGQNTPQIRISGDMKAGETWGGSNVTYGEYLYRVWNDIKLFSEPWQWFTSDLINCKVTPRSFRISQSSTSKAMRVYEAMLKLYSLAGHDELTWYWG